MTYHEFELASTGEPVWILKNLNMFLPVMKSRGGPQGSLFGAAQKLFFFFNNIVYHYLFLSRLQLPPNNNQRRRPIISNHKYRFSFVVVIMITDAHD